MTDFSFFFFFFTLNHFLWTCSLAFSLVSKGAVPRFPYLLLKTTPVILELQLQGDALMPVYSQMQNHLLWFVRAEHGGLKARPLPWAFLRLGSKAWLVVEPGGAAGCSQGEGQHPTAWGSLLHSGTSLRAPHRLC